MPTNLVPPAIPQFSPASGMVTGPADGDPLVAASVNIAFAPLADRSKVCFDGLRGVRSSYGQFICEDGVNWYCSGFAAGRGLSRAYELQQTNGTIATFGLGALAINTLYYVYARESAGTWNFIASTQGPDPWRRYMVGDENNIFLTYFATDSAGDPWPWSQVDTYYSFLNPPLLLSNAAAAAFTLIATDKFLPPWVNLATTFARLTNTDAANSTIAEFSKLGTVANGIDIATGRAHTAGVLTYSQAQVDMPVDEGVGFRYKVTGGAGALSVYLTGGYL